MKQILFVLLLALPILTGAQEVDTSKLVAFIPTSVFDGDGFKGYFPKDGRRGEVRLFGVDAPEKRGYSSTAQDYGNQSGDSLRLLVKGKAVYLDTLTMKGKRQTDRWGRTLAVVYLADATNVNYTAVRKGWAWPYRVSDSRMENFNTVLRIAQKSAQKEKAGLWVNSKAYAPALHRSWFSIFR